MGRGVWVALLDSIQEASDLGHEVDDIRLGQVVSAADDARTLAEPWFTGDRFPVVMIDGVEYAGETMVVSRPDA
jgi:hypothetical protein